VHECKVKVDGITKYVENHDFKADQVYSHTSTSESLYKHSVS
jgi:kinesin family protein 2/24